LESHSITRGLVAADACLKAAPIRMVWSRTIEPGKHLNLFTGEVDAVRAALRAGKQALGDDLAGELFLANLHTDVLRAVERAGPTPRFEAVGLIECRTVAAAFLAADAARKEAEVQLLRVKIEGGMGGRALVILTGSESDIESALGAGASLVEERDQLHRAETIHGPEPALLDALLEL
jgi:microcompartment protein CcmL/EutN